MKQLNGTLFNAIPKNAVAFKWHIVEKDENGMVKAVVFAANDFLIGEDIKDARMHTVKAVNNNFWWLVEDNKLHKSLLEIFDRNHKTIAQYRF